jgi:hypothetical protein
MECDICRTLAQQLRSYEMEIEDAFKKSSIACSDVTQGSLLRETLEQSRKTGLLYEHHRDTFHVSSVSAIEPDWKGTAEPLMHTAPCWADDLSRMSHKHVLNVMDENRAWNKRLREETSVLVNTRLAKTITQEEYVSRRDHAKDDVAECKRRAGILVKDMAIRERGLLPFVC